VHGANAKFMRSFEIINCIITGEGGIFGPKCNEVTGEWRKLHNEEPNNLCCSLNIIRVNRSRRMKWTGHVARMGGEERCIQGFGGKT
jgi:hypothetical protein